MGPCFHTHLLQPKKMFWLTGNQIRKEPHAELLKEVTTKRNLMKLCVEGTKNNPAAYGVAFQQEVCVYLQFAAAPPCCHGATWHRRGVFQSGHKRRGANGGMCAGMQTTKFEAWICWKVRNLSSTYRSIDSNCRLSEKMVGKKKSLLVQFNNLILLYIPKQIIKHQRVVLWDKLCIIWNPWSGINFFLKQSLQDKSVYHLETMVRQRFLFEAKVHESATRFNIN